MCAGEGIRSLETRFHRIVGINFVADFCHVLQDYFRVRRNVIYFRLASKSRSFEAKQ